MATESQNSYGEALPVVRRIDLGRKNDARQTVNSVGLSLDGCDVMGRKTHCNDSERSECCWKFKVPCGSEGSASELRPSHHGMV
jgi:hypothetical protein